MNTNRIASLIRYDWMLHKHNIKLTYGVIAIIYIAITLLYIISKSAISILEEGSNFVALPNIIGMFCTGFFNFAGIAILLVMANIVAEKFCHPRTATAYLTLPGTSTEKFCVVFIELAVAYLALKVLYIIMFYITMGVGYFGASELDWAQNVLHYIVPTKSSIQNFQNILEQMTGNSGATLEQLEAMDAEFLPFVKSIRAMTEASIWMEPIANILIATYYLILVMLFKTNVQIKAIGCYVLTNVAYNITIFITVICLVGNMFFNLNTLKNSSPEAGKDIAFGMVNSLCGFFDVMIVINYCIPFLTIALLYLFYRQICRKQAK